MKEKDKLPVMNFQPTDKTVPELILGSKVSIYKKSVMPRTGYIGPELNLVISTMSNVLSRQAWFTCYDVLELSNFFKLCQRCNRPRRLSVLSKTKTWKWMTNVFKLILPKFQLYNLSHRFINSKSGQNIINFKVFFGSLPLSLW